MLIWTTRDGGRYETVLPSQESGLAPLRASRVSVTVKQDVPGRSAHDRWKAAASMAWLAVLAAYIALALSEIRFAPVRLLPRWIWTAAALGGGPVGGLIYALIGRGGAIRDESRAEAMHFYWWALAGTFAALCLLVSTLLVLQP